MAETRNSTLRNQLIAALFLLLSLGGISYGIIDRVIDAFDNAPPGGQELAACIELHKLTGESYEQHLKDSTFLRRMCGPFNL